jgi:ubiquitin-like domain-containing CTD phosphatase 1
VVNDLDVDVSENPAAAAAYKNDQRNIRKVKEATKKLQVEKFTNSAHDVLLHTMKVNIIHPLREGKRLLVLDIDYSKIEAVGAIHTTNLSRTAILDTKPLTSGSLPPAECARPRLHEFLEAVYPYYDICIWFVSRTFWPYS